MVMCAIFKLCKFLVKKLEVVKKLMWFKVRKKKYYPSIARITLIEVSNNQGLAANT